MMIGRGVALVLLIGLCAGPPTAGAASQPQSGPPLVQPSHPDGLTHALADGSITPAQEALYRARAISHPGRVAARFGSVSPPASHDATLILRDLSVRLDQLPPDQRKAAHRILARPADPGGTNIGDWTTPEAAGSPDCNTVICIHWTSGGADAPDPADADANGYPDWIDTALSVASDVWNTEVDSMGYRAPESDIASTDNGGDARLDIYISDLGAPPNPLYGFCTSDDPALNTPGVYDASAYCVVDNDYAENVFSSHSPVDNLRVTLAHEFFHAVQASYDWFEDAWLMEGTATWMEDQVYTSINDNRQYLSTSQLTSPWVPLDHSNGCCYQYGSWIWFRFLSESMNPDVIQQIWNRADAAPGGPDDYSTQAIRHVLAADNTSFTKKLAQFAVWNRMPRRMYSEGKAGRYPTPASSGVYGLSTRHRTTGWLGMKLKHMSSSYLSFKPGRHVGNRPHLTVQVDDPSQSANPAARLIVFGKSGSVHVKSFHLNGHGNGSLRIRFGRNRVSKAVLVETNAGSRFDCWLGKQYSCQGTPLDDDHVYAFRARLH